MSKNNNKKKKEFKLEREDKQRIAIMLSLLFFTIISYFFIDKNVILGGNNAVLDYLLGWATHFLTVIFILLIMTTLFMWEEHKREWIIPLWCSFILSFVVSMIIKFIVARDRPEEAVFFWFDKYSFPSTHAAVSFSAVALLDQEYPSIKWFWVAFGIAVAFSRLWFADHYLSDIIGGILLGYSIGVGVYYLIKRYSIV